jgi:branched-chain amino acid transport system permease protein
MRAASHFMPPVARVVPALLLVIIAAAAVAFLSPFHLNQLTLVAAYCIALVGLNLVVGLAGQISLAHGAFFAIGAYGAAILVTRGGLPFPLALFGAGLIAMVAGFATGLPAVRLRGHYLATATLALSVAVPPVANRWTDLTGGASGIEMGSIEVPAWLPLGHDAYLFIWAAGLAALAMWAANRLAGSPFGLSLIAVRENEIAAVAMGINLAAAKVGAFAISALLAGIAGGIFAQSVGFVAPENFGLVLSLMFLVGLVVGGVGSARGTIVGALFLRFIPDYAAEIDRYLAGVLLGAAIILSVRFMPQGPFAALVQSLNWIKKAAGARLRPRDGNRSTWVKTGGHE